ncbi:hypothetical protein ACFL1R_02670 [Candidatus Latescibacterota bacterium]
MKAKPFIIILFISLIPLPGADAQVKAGGTETKKSLTDSAQVVLEDSLLYSRPVTVYDSGGKRDPFKSLAPKPVETGKKIKGLFNYDNASLKGIIKTEDDIYALVVDENEAGHVLREGYRVFGGYVTRITDDTVYLHIVKYGRAMSIVMRMETSKATIIEEVTGGESYVKKPGINIIYRQSDTPDSEILIEDVYVPSLDIKTVDEEWFGESGTSPFSDKAEKESDQSEGSETMGAFSLIDPPDNSWITLPYELDWTTMIGNGIRYSIFIDDNTDFSSPFFIKEEIKTSAFLLDEETEFPANKKLFWKVIAHDASGEQVSCRRTDMSFRVTGKQ